MHPTPKPRILCSQPSNLVVDWGDLKLHIFDAFFQALFLSSQYVHLLVCRLECSSMADNLMLRCMSKLGDSLFMSTGALSKLVSEVVVIVLKPLVALSEGIQTGKILRS